ncbi:MAG: hypothetical protein C0467_09355 [Planctomycetaceae bacterium]|nr:hypothetical protein [Planctomycetaceae bacterium]
MKPGSRKWDEAIWAAGAAGKRPDWADVMWYAVDGLGCVGMFTSGGPGPIPRSVFRDLDAHNSLANYLRDLPFLGKPELLIRYKRTDAWRQAAERGLYAFDYDGDSELPTGYRLVARPKASCALSLGSLPIWAQEQFGALCVSGESFAESAGRVLDLSGVRSGLVE